MVQTLCQDLIRLAEQMEHEAGRFYAALADGCPDKTVADLLKVMAGEEEQHALLFRNLLAQVPCAGELEPSLRGYLERLVQGFGSRTSSTPEGDTWELAVGMEMDSLLLYLEISHILPTGYAEQLKPVIRAERQHYLKILGLKLAWSFPSPQEQHP